jgi:hypothetical protein
LVVAAFALSKEKRIETPGRAVCFTPSTTSGIFTPQQSRTVGAMSVQ